MTDNCYSNLSYKLTKLINKKEKQDNGIYFTPPNTIIKALNILFDYNKTQTNKVVTGLVGWKDLDNVSVTGYTLLPYTSIILLKP
jgi:hypothetical protein